MEAEDDQSSLKEKEIARDRDTVFIEFPSCDKNYFERILKSYMDENRINLCVLISLEEVKIFANKKRVEKAKELAEIFSKNLGYTYYSTNGFKEYTIHVPKLLTECSSEPQTALKIIEEAVLREYENSIDCGWRKPKY